MRQEELIAESRACAPDPVGKPPIHPPIDRPPRHRGGRAHRGGSPHWSWLGPAKGPSRPPPRGDPLVTIVAHELKASYAFIERNFFLTRRYWGWEARLPGLFRRGRAVDLAHRCRPGQPRAAADADGGSDLLELPVGRLQLDRRDDVGRALGRDPGVHLHGPGPALVAAARQRHLRDGLRPRSTRP